jgi:hypothetical protein
MITIPCLPKGGGGMADNYISLDEMEKKKDGKEKTTTESLVTLKYQKRRKSIFL